MHAFLVGPTWFMCPVSVGSTLIQPDLCTFFQSAHPHPTRFMHAFQSAQPQSNPIYVCCFGRVNPNPTWFMHIFSIGQSQSNQIYACFFGRANLIYVCCFGWVNPNPTWFMHIFSIGPPPSNPIYVCFSISPTPIQPDLRAFFRSGRVGPTEKFMNSPTRSKWLPPTIILGMHQLISQWWAISQASAESAGPVYNSTLCHFVFRS